jgi:hypothetical protein
MATDRPERAARHVHEVILGEITTSLLDTSDPVSPATATQLLDLLPGCRPKRASHPVGRAQSPDLGLGVDCRVPTGSGGGARAIGIVAAHAVLTGGHVVQGSAYARVLIGTATARRTWAHYLAQPGVVEVIRKARAADLSEAFLTAPRNPELLDLGAIGSWVLHRVQDQPTLDRGSRLRARSGRLRWAVEIDDSLTEPSSLLRLLEDDTYLVLHKARSVDLEGIVGFCEDVALHAWLLAALNGAVERSLRTGDRFDELAPALEYLGHLWHPRAYLDPSLHHLWQQLIEEGPQLSREWQSQVTRIRDLLTMLTLRARDEGFPQEPFRAGFLR